jgi:hypothetical protein
MKTINFSAGGGSNPAIGARAVNARFSLSSKLPISLTQLTETSGSAGGTQLQRRGSGCSGVLGKIERDALFSIFSYISKLEREQLVW